MTYLSATWEYLLKQMRGNGKDPPFPARFLAGAFGSLTLYTALFFTYLSRVDLVDSYFLKLILYYIVISVIFIGFVVASGEGKGSLAMHFLYGVLLPGAAYLVAGLILSFYP